MLISEIKQIIDGLATLDCRTDEDLDITYLLTDSRKLADGLRVTGGAPERILFFAIKTEKNDGAKYIDELYENGVRAFVTGDSIDALQAIAAYRRKPW